MDLQFSEYKAGQIVEHDRQVADADVWINCSKTRESWKCHSWFK